MEHPACPATVFIQGGKCKELKRMHTWLKEGLKCSVCQHPNCLAISLCCPSIMSVEDGDGWPAGLSQNIPQWLQNFGDPLSLENTEHANKEFCPEASGLLGALWALTQPWGPRKCLPFISPSPHSLNCHSLFLIIIIIIVIGGVQLPFSWSRPLK